MSEIHVTVEGGQDPGIMFVETDTPELLKKKAEKQGKEYIGSLDEFIENLRNDFDVTHHIERKDGKGNTIGVGF